MGEDIALVQRPRVQSLICCTSNKHTLAKNQTFETVKALWKYELLIQDLTSLKIVIFLVTQEFKRTVQWNQKID